MAAKLLLAQLRKPDDCGFGAGFEATMLLCGMLTRDICLERDPEVNFRSEINV
jgi:hypothetical protein